jgi:hypothetical protein
MPKYEEGSIWYATINGKRHLVMRAGGRWRTGYFVSREGDRCGSSKACSSSIHHDYNIKDLRRALVLNPDDAPMPLDDPTWFEAAAMALAETNEDQDLGEIKLQRWIAGQVEAQLTDKLAEPRGLGAIVVDSDGTEWIRSEYYDGPTANPWYNVLVGDEDLDARSWHEIDAVEIVHSGRVRKERDLPILQHATSQRFAKAREAKALCGITWRPKAPGTVKATGRCPSCEAIAKALPVVWRV